MLNGLAGLAGKCLHFPSTGVTKVNWLFTCMLGIGTQIHTPLLHESFPQPFDALGINSQGLPITQGLSLSLVISLPSSSAPHLSSNFPSCLFYKAHSAPAPSLSHEEGLRVSCITPAPQGVFASHPIGLSHSLGLLLHWHIPQTISELLLCPAALYQTNLSKSRVGPVVCSSVPCPVYDIYW